MRVCLIGHRGVGKTSLLQRLQIYGHLQNDAIPVYDLDREIEKAVGAKIADIFALVGEKNFRDLEWGIFQQISFAAKYVISLGAGFPLERIPAEFRHSDEIQFVWVRRRTDSLGRIFLDRPRLNPEMTPLAEYQERLSPRSEKYYSFCDWIYEMPEGLVAPSAVERALFYNQLQDLSGWFTLQKYHLQHPMWWQNQLCQWGCDAIELRDDLLSIGEIDQALATLAPGQVVLTHRLSNTGPLQSRVRPGMQVDWPLELGPVPGHASLVSLHERHPGESVLAAAQRLEQQSGAGRQQKLAVLVDTWQELEDGLNWQSEKPNLRSFLPRSAEGRWRWFRLWMKGRQKINFIHDGSGEVADQPSLWQWASTPLQMTGSSVFAAVLGFPVEHSYTPVEHAPFFQIRQAPVFAIPVQTEEWAGALSLLQRMGLRWAAVTSPLKEQAFASAAFVDVSSQHLRAVNTLSWTSQGWRATNTDQAGLRALFESLETMGATVIWGGGGTLSALQELLPEAVAYSVRSGQPRGESRAAGAPPETLIWAASPTGALPPMEWRPRQVVDLNYRDDSRAKEYCQITGARYISGLVMFKAQAEAQRQFLGDLMAANSFGQHFVLHSFGESHGVGLGAVIDGCPANIPFLEDILMADLARRRPGHGVGVSQRQEADRPEVLSGVFEGKTLGTPIAILVRNEDQRSHDYDKIKVAPRAGHADDMWKLKFGHSDHRGGGRSSGRETLARVIGGAVAKMVLQQFLPSLRVTAHVAEIGGKTLTPEEAALFLQKAQAQGESWGGWVQLKVDNPPVGLGQPVFHKLKSDLAAAMMSIGAATGVELGAGLQSTVTAGTQFHRGSESVYGGIRGGLSTGDPIEMRIAFKPTSSLLDVAKQGRHDPSIVVRAAPVCEAMAAMVILDHVLWQRLDR